MLLHSTERDDQFVRDSLIGISSNDESQELQFTRGQRLDGR